MIVRTWMKGIFEALTLTKPGMRTFISLIVVVFRMEHIVSEVSFSTLTSQQGEMKR